MSIISKALEKEMKEQHQARKISGVEELPGTEAPPTAASIIQHRTESPRPQTPVRHVAQRRAVAPGIVDTILPANFGKQFFFLGGMLALVAVGVGFFMSDSLTSTRQSGNVPAPQTNAVVAAPPAEPPAPAQTPVVVRVEVNVKSEGSSNEPTMIPVDRGTLFESDPEPVRKYVEPETMAEPVEIPEPPPPPPAPKPAKLTLAQVREQYKVDGIFYGDGDPMTIINDEIVREGHDNGDYTVVKIKPDCVIVKIKDTEYELR